MSYRYREIDVSGLGRFDENSKLEFLEGLTVVGAENGLGKTTLCHALMGDYPNRSISVEGKIDFHLPRWIYFFQAEENYPMPGQIWGNFKTLFEKKTQIVFDHATLAAEISEYASLLLSKKRAAEAETQFERLGAGDPITVSVDEHYRLSIASSTGQSLNSSFGMGDSLLLHVSLLRAARDQLGFMLEPPLVLDDPFGFLGESLRNTIIPFVLSFPTQIVLVWNHQFYGKYAKEPDYLITRDLVSDHSVIEKK